MKDGMGTDAKQIGQVATRALTAVAASQEQSTKGLTGSTDHKRAFLETFRRWELLFKRKDTGDMQAEKWLIAEYYDSLGHLSVAGFEALTRLLKENCTFFPTVRECLDLMRPKDRYDWGHPFLSVANGQSSPLIAAKPRERVLAIQNAPRLAAPDDDVS
jgi:hypothetical protein